MLLAAAAAPMGPAAAADLAVHFGFRQLLRLPLAQPILPAVQQVPVLQPAAMVVVVALPVVVMAVGVVDTKVELAVRLIVQQPEVMPPVLVVGQGQAVRAVSSGLNVIIAQVTQLLVVIILR